MTEQVFVVDNFLTPSYAKTIADRIDNHSQEWYFQKNISYQQGFETEPLDYGFHFPVVSPHDGIDNTNTALFLVPALLQMRDFIKATTILRARLDMTVATGITKKHRPHTDMDESKVTMIYYVNDSDGNTEIYNETQESEQYTLLHSVEPKMNRLVIFSARQYHTGHSPQRHQNRILLNANFA